MNDRIKAGLIIASLLLNAYFAYTVLANQVYKAGMNAQAQIDVQSINAAIDAGQILIPQPNEEEITD